MITNQNRHGFKTIYQDDQLPVRTYSRWRFHEKAFVLTNVYLSALAPHFNFPGKPQVIKTSGGQRLLNPIQLNNLAQILPGSTSLPSAFPNKLLNRMITTFFVVFVCLYKKNRPPSFYLMVLAELRCMLDTQNKISG